MPPGRKSKKTTSQDRQKLMLDVYKPNGFARHFLGDVLSIWLGSATGAGRSRSARRNVPFESQTAMAAVVIYGRGRPTPSSDPCIRPGGGAPHDAYENASVFSPCDRCLSRRRRSLLHKMQGSRALSGDSGGNPARGFESGADGIASQGPGSGKTP